MPDPAADLERIRAVLIKASHTWTRPRAEVSRVLIEAVAPLKVDEIHDCLRQSPRRRINLSSVYRTLHLLRALSIARTVRLSDGLLRYELDDAYRGHHHHFVCEICGRIEDVQRCPVQGVDLGVSVRSHSLELYGLCRVCAPTRRSEHVRS